MQDLLASGLPKQAIQFFEGILIARGVDQAFRTKTELVNFKKVMLHLQNMFEVAEADLSVFAAMLYVPHGTEGGKERKKDILIMKDLDECRGMLHVLREVRTWTAAICKVSRFPTQERLFVASDSEIRRIPAEMGAARGLKGRLDALEAKVASRTGEIKALVEREGWPPRCAGSTPGTAGGESGGSSMGTVGGAAGGGAGKGQRECGKCGAGFGRKWLHGALCWMCREELKGRGECWVRRDAQRGGKDSCFVCPHAGKCLGCEEASCSACRMVRMSEMDEGLKTYLLVSLPSPDSPHVIVSDPRFSFLFDCVVCMWSASLSTHAVLFFVDVHF